MTEEKRGRGRPKKVVEEVAPKNPDCEHATKGYVKCIARQVFYHNHEQNVDGSASIMAAILGWIAFCATLFGFGMGPSIMSFGWYPTSSVALAFSVACTVMYYEISHIGGINTNCIDNDKTQRTIKKHEPPKCEQKKECGED